MMSSSSPGFDPRAHPSADAFARNGFVVLNGFLRPDEVAAARADIDALMVAPQSPGCRRPHNTLLPLRWNNPIVWLALAAEQRRRALSEAVRAEDLRWISGYVSVKEAASPALWWHQDWWCWDHPVTFQRAAPQLAVLCYLTDIDHHNGGLRVLPGSHHQSQRIHAALPEAHTHAAEGLEPAHPAMSDLPGQVSLRLKAGDAVALDYRLLHGTHANASTTRRDCIVLSFTPAWRRLPADVRAHLISHPAQPTAGDAPPPSWQADLLPSFNGPRRDLPLRRHAPAQFRIVL